jgi:dTDP-4-dehydrorhamnose reductase
MRVLILGGSGMVGHRLWMAARPQHETWVTLRTPLEGQPWAGLFDAERVISDVSGDEPGSLDRAFEIAQPEVVINAIGLIKQRASGTDVGASFVANSFVPHYVRRLCDRNHARLVHISTDCVFVGDRGHYSEDDVPDAVDTYGLTKRLGEVGTPHLTLRFSAIGRSLHGNEGLIEWFLGQNGNVRGYRSALFSGHVTDELARTVLKLVDDHPSMAGIWHVAAEPIDKYSLLLRLREAYGHDVDITPVDEPEINRTLNDERFRAATGIPRPSWDDMIRRLATDPTPYRDLRA